MFHDETDITTEGAFTLLKSRRVTSREIAIATGKYHYRSRHKVTSLPYGSFRLVHSVQHLVYSHPSSIRLSPENYDFNKIQHFTVKSGVDNM